MLQSIEQSRKALELITKAFKITKNIPIDYRFIVSSLANLDTEIPMQYRYNGLVFYVVNQEVNSGLINDKSTSVNGSINVGGTNGVTINTGILYCFESDLTTPIPLHDTVLRYIVRSLTGFKKIGDYSNLIERLNTECYAKSGSIVDIPELGISVIYDGTNWKWFAGTYTIASDEWDTIPNQLKIPNKIVHYYVENGDIINKIILSDLTLSDEVLTADNVNECTEKWRYYLVQDKYLYFTIGDKAYPIGSEYQVINNFTIETGDNKLPLQNQDYQNILDVTCMFNYWEDNKFPEENPVNLRQFTVNVIQQQVADGHYEYYVKSYIRIENVTLLIKFNQLENI